MKRGQRIYMYEQRPNNYWGDSDEESIYEFPDRYKKVVDPSKEIGEPVKEDPPKTEEEKYGFTVKIDKVYTEKEFLKVFLQQEFHLTPDDAEILIREGWHFTNHKTITEKDLNTTRNITVTKKDYEGVMGKVVDGHPDSNLAKLVAKLATELEDLKKISDAAYSEYNAVAFEFLSGKGMEFSFPVMYSDNTSVVLTTPQGTIITGNTGGPIDQKLVGEEMSNENGKFEALKRKYPGIPWSYNNGRNSLGTLALIVVERYRNEEDNTINDYFAATLRKAIIQYYHSSKLKALHALVLDELSDKSVSPMSELIYYESIRNDYRQLGVTKGVVSPEVIEAWASAQIEILKAQITYRETGETRLDKDVLKSFYDVLIPFINEKTTTETYENAEPGLDFTVTKNPIIELHKLYGITNRVRVKAEPESFPRLFDDFIVASRAMDDLIELKLRDKKMNKEADILDYSSTMSMRLDRLLQKNTTVYKVNALFYPENITDYMDLNNKKSVTEMGTPLQLYLTREEDEWVLTDLTRIDQEDPPTNRNKNLDNLFAELDSHLRFPKGSGTLFWKIPGIERSGKTTITGDLSLAEWFTYIGLAIGAVLLALATMGVSVPATLVIVTSGVIITGSVLNMIEKSEQGMLTTKDVVLELAIIVSAASAGITAGLGKIVFSGAEVTGRMATMANRFYFPIARAELAADSMIFGMITADAVEQYQEIAKLPDGQMKDDAMLRLFATFILQGSMMVMAVKSDLVKVKGKVPSIKPKEIDLGNERDWLKVHEFDGDYRGHYATYYDVEVKYQKHYERVGVAFEEEGILEFHLNIPSNLEKQGIGSEIFKRAINDYSSSKVKGWWKKMDIYEFGESANLSIFKAKIEEGIPASKAVFETPTGKILKANNFGGTPEIIKNTSDEVIVLFNPTK